jgi:hypothetical protein
MSEHHHTYYAQDFIPINERGEQAHSYWHHVFEVHDNELEDLIRKLSIKTDLNTYPKEITIHPVYWGSCGNPNQHVAQLSPFIAVAFSHPPPDWNKQEHESLSLVSGGKGEL